MPEMIFRSDRPQKGDIEVFLEQAGRPLPPAYQEFLSVYNGGRPASQFRYSAALDGIVEVDILFGVGLGKAFNISAWTAAFQDELPPNTLIIGGDPLGNFFTLDLVSGAVFYWDHIRLYHLSHDQGNVYLVAESIAYFLEDEIDPDLPLMSNHIGPNGPKEPENIWYKSETGLQEIERGTFVNFTHLEGYCVAA